MSYDTNKEGDELLTKNQTVVGSIYSDNIDVDLVPQYFRVQFYLESRTGINDSTGSTTWLDTALCKDLYSDEIEAEDNWTESNQFFATEFLNTYLPWVCPDVKSLEVRNDPKNFYEGQTLVMVINECNIAKQIEQENELKSYVGADIDCVN